MKQLSIIINLVLVVAIAVLYFLFFTKKNKTDVAKTSIAANMPMAAGSTSIAYFDMDSLERNYNYIKDVQVQLKAKEQGIGDELETLKKKYTVRIEQLQSKAQSMNQQEGEAAQAEINQMQQTLQQREGQLTQALQDDQFKMMQNINSRIEAFLKEFNQQKRFSYIFSHRGGDFIYYKDSMCNITRYILDGLNKEYKTK